MQQLIRYACSISYSSSKNRFLFAKFESHYIDGLRIEREFVILIFFHLYPHLAYAMGGGHENNSSPASISVPPGR